MKGTWEGDEGEKKRRRDEETKKEALVGEAFFYINTGNTTRRSANFLFKKPIYGLLSSGHIVAFVEYV